MSETSQEERDQWCDSPAEMVRRLTHDADRLAKLEDGIRALVDEIEPDDSVPHWVFRRIDALLDD